MNAFMKQIRVFLVFSVTAMVVSLTHASNARGEEFFPETAGAGGIPGPAVVRSLDDLVTLLAGRPIYGGSRFPETTVREIFAAAGCETEYVFASRVLPDTGVVSCVDAEGRQKTVLNVIRPQGLNRFPLVYINPWRKLFSPNSGFEIYVGSLEITMGGTVVDSDLGVYQLTRIAGVLTAPLWNSRELVGLKGEMGQYLVLQSAGFYHGVMQSKTGSVITFDIVESGILYHVNDLKKLDAGDTISVLGTNGVWWIGEVAAPLTGEGILRIVPTSAKLEPEGEAGGQPVMVTELALVDIESAEESPHKYERGKLVVKTLAADGNAQQ